MPTEQQTAEAPPDASSINSRRLVRTLYQTKVDAIRGLAGQALVTAPAVPDAAACQEIALHSFMQGLAIANAMGIAIGTEGGEILPTDIKIADNGEGVDMPIAVLGLAAMIFNATLALSTLGVADAAILRKFLESRQGITPTTAAAPETSRMWADEVQRFVVEELRRQGFEG